MEFEYCFTSSGFIWFQWSLQDYAGAEAGTQGRVPCSPWRCGLCLLGVQLQYPSPKHCVMYLAHPIPSKAFQHVLRHWVNRESILTFQMGLWAFFESGCCFLHTLFSLNLRDF